MKKRAAKKAFKNKVAKRYQPTLVKPPKGLRLRWTDAELKELDRSFVDFHAEIAFRGTGDAQAFQSWLLDVLRANSFPVGTLRVRRAVVDATT